MYQLKAKAHKKLIEARKKGITTAKQAEVIRIVLKQEIVSYCTSKGCVSFDYNDLICEG